MGIVFGAHDLADVASLHDSRFVMRAGRAVERRASSDILSRPAADYTGALLEAAEIRPGDRAS